LYLAISFTASMVVPTEQLAASEGALLEVVRQGPILIPERLFSLIALVAVSNTALVALIMASRVLYGMAREGVLPRVLARTHRSRRTPWVAIVFTTLIALILLTTADVGRLADTTVVFILIVFLLVNTSVLVLRRDRVDHDHFTAPTVVPVLGIVACLVLMVQIGINDIGVYAYAGVLLVAGLALYGLNALLKRRLDSVRTTRVAYRAPRRPQIPDGLILLPARRQVERGPVVPGADLSDHGAVRTSRQSGQLTSIMLPASSTTYCSFALGKPSRSPPRRAKVVRRGRDSSL
jgi:amino acid transporter